jgi:disulfide oxidoreductase YuzD
MNIEELEVTLKMLDIHYSKIINDIYIDIKEFKNDDELKDLFFELLFTNDFIYHLVHFNDESYGVYIIEKK